mmetsp:Transcript_21392/g.32602  ORF Transcript_21392/g.32602 Transcript_21392/m.32602 type:complete len:514 (+) Transcript_21392:113-1654(+)|eukprot:CAMPEP_0196809572 /NCGR_PEP_ID=MMETSP1362-20130617/9490_1 /TAXON_ID=163516 /ORGANISM="Leptocylindrus danicus, Strain CCMP1856" /LENGTH=513 /DNA_ID=CAMNT_0042184301 /DNA_START=69 /DNA_END=1610 /DNA_ORIENTATION=+
MRSQAASLALITCIFRACSASATAVDGQQCTLDNDTCLEQNMNKSKSSVDDGDELSAPAVDDQMMIQMYGVGQEVSGAPNVQEGVRGVLRQSVAYMETLEDEVKKDCKNTHQLCSFWASVGECDGNPTYMRKGCAVACRSCDGKNGKDSDNISSSSNANAEIIKKQAVNDKSRTYGEVQTIEGTRAKEVQKIVDDTPFYMLSVENAKDCLNRHELCSYWAVIGECNKNKAYMKTNCAPACRSCDMLDFDARCPVLSDEVNPPIYQRGEMHEMFVEIANGKFDQYEPTVHARPNVNVPTDRDAVDVLVGDNMPWVITFDSFLTPEECDRLIKLGYDKGYERSKDVGAKKFDGSYDGYESKKRTSENAWCDKECDKDPVANAVMNRITEVTGVPKTNSEHFQILRYREGQFYRVHHDYIGHQKQRNSGPRILTFFLYLSDVEEGGGTGFPSMNNLTVVPKKGRALLWPSVLSDDPSEKDGITMHEAQPVIKGTKFAANAWLHLKNYRQANDEGCA